MNVFELSRIRVVVAVLAIAFFLATAHGSSAQNPTFVIGSSNTVKADPPVPRPQETPCIVPLFSGFQFIGFNIQSFSFTPPPDCPGPWEKIVFTGDFNVTAGRQFDRTAIVDLGYVNIYFGTTPEPRNNLSPSWHVERDLTEYSALFGSPQTGHVILGNVVNSTFTGVISGSAALEFYPSEGAGNGNGQRPAAAVLPLVQPNGQGGNNEPAFLFTSTDQLATTFTLPQNIERASLEVITQSQIGDEFWYTCVPNDVANELQSCGNTAFREAEVSIDGQPAGVAPVYPWIYTGGIDPLFWEPIPGVQALNFAPYRVDLTPFAGVLSNGQQHTVALNVFNANGYFSATATLLLYLDHGSQQVTGEVTANTIGSAPNPTINENIQTDASGNITGTVTTVSSREFSVAGFVNTSHGRVATQVNQTVNFNNVQNFTITASTYVQDISQETDVKSATTTWQGPVPLQTLETFQYPLTVNLSLTFAPDGSGSQLGTVSQEFQNTFVSPFLARTVDNKVNTTDTLNFNSSGHITGNSGAESSQSYNSSNSRGQKYSCTLTSQNNALTSVNARCASNQNQQ
jgi:hypothetical protein